MTPIDEQTARWQTLQRWHDYDRQEEARQKCFRKILWIIAILTTAAYFAFGR